MSAHTFAAATRASVTPLSAADGAPPLLGGGPAALHGVVTRASDE
jgi:hypothetical protein